MSHKGQSLTEYSLAIGTVALSSIFALLLLSNNMKSQYSSMIPAYGNTLAVTSPATLSVQPITPSSPSANKNTALITPVSSLADTQAQLEVTGANGTTKALLNDLQVQVQQWLASGKITDDQANTLTILANQGHQVAEAEKALEDAVAQGAEQISFKGNTYPVQQFAKQLGISPPDAVWTLSPQYAEPLMAPFMNQYQTVLQSGALTDPDIKTYITSLSYQIVGIGDAFSWSFDRLSSSGSTPISSTTLSTDIAQTFLMDMQGTPLTKGAGSAQTHNNAAKICATGSGEDTGKHCDP